MTGLIKCLASDPSFYRRRRLRSTVWPRAAQVARCKAAAETGAEEAACLRLRMRIRATAAELRTAERAAERQRGAELDALGASEPPALEPPPLHRARPGRRAPPPRGASGASGYDGPASGERGDVPGSGSGDDPPAHTHYSL